MADDLFSGGARLRLAEEQAAIDNERRRIARDIHDGAAQQFAHVLHKLELIQHILASETQPSRRVPLALIEVERAQNILQAGLADLRSSIAALLPAQLEHQDLGAALRALLQECMLNHPGLEISDNLEDLPPLPSTLEVAIFRFVQEALNNACTHGRATHISIQVERQPHALALAVSDNGAGFQAHPAISNPVEESQKREGQEGDRLPGGAWGTSRQRIGPSFNHHSLNRFGRAGIRANGGRHMGLRGMRERIEQAGGSWEIESRSGAGTTVRARFPLSL
jgi:signal transduction histidine kinase